ncbi:hypothetical protein [Erythrobacter sp. THAF29]|uniref:hypothetical protein n=1 Tax=Erythrobacter sp. THAF29 TaxID=2587851 RepID=UPI0012694B90|nr:hypothetical protein [Erythrobacter sp. THAF29]QFT76634.1 hypothetical protein FIU90_03655 [Erythrobacter sp. THAF29]
MFTRTKLTAAPLAIAAAALALPLTAPALAGEKEIAEAEPIVVISQPAMQAWQEATTADLNRALVRDPIARKVQPNNAVVEVAFTLGYDGRAENIRVLPGQGNWSARRAAKYAVRTLDTLGDVPVANPEGTRFLASIIFADTIETHDKLAAKAAKARAQRFANVDEEDRPILLGG